MLVLALLWVFPASAQEPALQIGHWLPQGAVNLEVSADGQLLLVAPHYYEDSGRNLELWDLFRGVRLAELHPAAQHISAHFLPDGQVAAIIEVSQSDGVQASYAHRWNRQGQRVGTPRPLWGELAEQPRAGASGQLLLSCWENHEQGDANGGFRWAEGRLQSWPLVGGEVRTLAGVRARIQRCSISSDGRWAVTLGGDSMLGIWELPSGKLRAKKFGVDQFQLSSHPERALIDGRCFQVPQLRPLGTSVGQRDTRRSGSQLYGLDGNRVQLLDPLTFRPRFAARLEAAPGFAESSLSWATPLPGGRLLLWDAQHRASAIARPERR